MGRLFFTLVLFSLFSVSCNKSTPKHKLKLIGTAAFRNSFLNHEKWSDAQRDSADKANPLLMEIGDSTGLKALNLLKTFDLANDNELFANKLDFHTDTLMIINEDTIFTKLKFSKEKAFLHITSRNITDTILIDNPTYGIRSLKTDSASAPLIMYSCYYYIMNGDNYEVSFYQIE